MDNVTSLVQPVGSMRELPEGRPEQMFFSILKPVDNILSGRLLLCTKQATSPRGFTFNTQDRVDPRRRAAGNMGTFTPTNPTGDPSVSSVKFMKLVGSSTSPGAGFDKVDTHRLGDERNERRTGHWFRRMTSVLQNELKWPE
jgi:hypothetical protein